MALVDSSKLENIVKMFENNIHPAHFGRVINHAAWYYEYSNYSPFPVFDNFIPADSNEISLLNVEAVNIPSTAEGVPVSFYTGFSNANNPSSRSTVSYSGKLILPFGIRQPGGILYSVRVGPEPASGELIKVKIQVYRVKI
jgi:hypothetical protein